MEAACYIAYLLSEPRQVSCVRASAVLAVSPDEVNRFLLDNNFTGQELFEAVKPGLCLAGGTLSADDSVLDKPFTNLDSFLRDKEVGFMVDLEANRIVSTQPGSYEQVGQIADLPQQGLFTHLKSFDLVKVFRTVDKQAHVRHYAMYLSDKEKGSQISRENFEQVKEQHWHVEEFFRTVKQECHAQDFFLRNTQAIKNHIFCVLRAFQRLVWMSQV